MTSIEERRQEVLDLPLSDRLTALAALQRETWVKTARPEQLPPEGEWRIWYLMAGRGAGKSRSAAETLSDWEATHPPGEWAVIAPTFADARDTCLEAPVAGLLPILGPRVAPGGWNRSIGEIHLRSGSKIYIDGADDGALRIQGKNLRGAWCDEIGLWKMWDKAWNESLSFAVRHDPARIVASGTPKMGHGLVRQLLEDKTVVVSRMRTSDNVGNLHPSAVAELYSRYGSTRLGQQELEGEWISAIEGDALKRAWWRYYDKHLLRNGRDGRIQLGNGEIKFQWVIISCDTPLKDKQASDNVAIQVWGVDKANRYLLDAENRQMSYEQAKRAIKEKARWARFNWRCQSRILIENAGYGPDLALELKREVGGVETVKANMIGNKGQRALAAAGDLETGNCFLPGKIKEDGSGPDERVSPAMTLSLVDECAIFQIDGSHDSHDDQVDSWSQAMNWLRLRQTSPARTWSSFKSRRST